MDKDDLARFSQFKYKIFSEYYNSKKVKLFSFSSALIKNLSSLSDLCIVSSAPEEVIDELLRKHRLRDKFFEIKGINKEGKKHTLQKYCEKYNKIYFISDTSGDILEAKGLSIITIAVDWGFHTHEMMKGADPDYVAHSYKEVIEIINS